MLDAPSLIYTLAICTPAANGYFLINIYTRRGRNRMVVVFTTTYTINAYHH
jgi:hypothetical protein